MNIARDAGERDWVMKVRRRGNGHGIDTFRDQLVDVSESAATRQFRRTRPMRRQRIDDTDQLDVRQADQHAGMIAAHHAGADYAHAKRPFRLGFHARCGPPGIHVCDPDRLRRNTRSFS